jgi:hypothetical protein
VNPDGSASTSITASRAIGSYIGMRQPTIVSSRKGALPATEGVGAEQVVSASRDPESPDMTSSDRARTRTNGFQAAARSWLRWFSAIVFNSGFALRVVMLLIRGPSSSHRSNPAVHPLVRQPQRPIWVDERQQPAPDPNEMLLNCTTSADAANCNFAIMKVRTAPTLSLWREHDFGH